jgi:mannose-6-phosphate isomerase-like protein (cupin superfamily)
MLVKRFHEHNVVDSHICGEIREIIKGPEYPHANVALSINIRPTVAHYHRDFDEIYFLLDGRLTLRFHDPSQGRTWDESLTENELVVIPKGIHHKVIEVSEKNRLCLITIPRFLDADQIESEVI